MKTTLALCTTCLLFLSGTQTLHSQLTIDAEIRARGEFRNGFKKPRPEKADPALFIEQRSRLYFGFKADRIKIQLNIQDVRIWGNADQVFKQDPALTNVHEAWGEVLLSDKFSAKIGRQEIDYDGARFLGNLGWAAQSRVHDALLLKFEDDSMGWKVHMGGAFNQNVPFEPSKLEGTYYSGVNNYKSMAYLWAHKTGDFGEVSFLFHNDGRQVLADSSMAYRQTLGLIGSFPLGASGFGLNGELYYQGGRDANDKQVSALLAAIHAHVKTERNQFTVGLEYLSGTAYDETDKNKAFDPLYGTNHKFYGFMDYFYVGNPHGQNGNTAGLINLYLQGVFQAGKGKFTAKVHNFSSPVKIKDPTVLTGDLSKQLGVEIDLVYNINIIPAVNVQAGYSQMFASAGMEALKGGGAADKFNNWVWLMVGFKPQLLKAENIRTR